MREIMKDAMMEVYDKLKNAEDIARQNRIKIANMNTKVDACVRTVGSVKKVEKSVEHLYKNFKEHDMKLIEMASKHETDI